jgi:hypothetical protein
MSACTTEFCDGLDEMGEGEVAHHEARLLALGVVFEYPLEPELGQHRLVLFAEVDGDAGIGVVAHVPDDAHRRGGRPLAAAQVHEIGHLVRARLAGASQENGDGHDPQAAAE